MYKRYNEGKTVGEGEEIILQKRRDVSKGGGR